MLKLGFRLHEVMEMPEDELLIWLKATRPKTKKGKKFIVRKKKKP